MNEKKKNSSIELLRLIATVGVIFCHVGICWLTYYGDSSTATERIIYKSLNLLCHWPVPVFMAITGSLLLGKENMSYGKMWKYFKRIALLTLSFGWLYSMMELYFNTRILSVSLLWEGMKKILSGNSWEHLWYMYMLLGIYLVLPVINLCKTKIPLSYCFWFLSVTFLFASLLPTIGIERTFVNYPITSIYLIYLIMGYILSSEKAQEYVKSHKINDMLLMGLCLLLFVVEGGMVTFDERIGLTLSKTWCSYTSPLVVLQSLIIFYLIVKRKNVFDRFCSNGVVKRMNRCSLGIYIVHMLWINIAIKLLHINLMDYGWIAILIGGASIYVLSWAMVEIMLKIPVLKNYL